MDKDKIIDTSVDSAVGLIPAFAGLTGNPFWVASAALLSPFLQQQIKETTHWLLGNIQRRKVEYSTQCLCETIVSKIQKEEKLRQDSFFEFKDNPQLRIEESSASKLTEGMLLKAKEEYDSKKIPFLSYLTANIFFLPDISESKAFVMLEILSKLSYRQLCALSIFYNKKKLPVGVWEARLKGTPSLQSYYDIAYEFISLKDLLLIEQYMPIGGIGMGIGISNYKISALGEELYIAANLTMIDERDLLDLNNKIEFITSSIH